MTKIVHIITGLGSGGAERVLYQLVRRSATKHGRAHIVISLSGEGFYGGPLRSAGAIVHTLGMRPNRPPIFEFCRLVYLLRRIRPEVVMTWLYHADLVGTFAAKLAGTRRIIWNLRCSEFVFSDHPPMTGRIVALLARLSRMPTVVAVNSIAGQRDHIRLGYDPKQWAYLPNGFDTTEWTPDENGRAKVRAELGLTSSDFVVARAGRVDPQKDFPTFIAAIRMLVPRWPSLRFALLGQGTEQLELPPDIERSALVLGLRGDMCEVIRAFDLVVSSSAYGEGLPNIVAESMASGVPCVVTDVGDSALLVGDSGIVVPPNDPYALAEAIQSMMTMPVEQLEQLGARARERVEANYSLATSLDRYDEIFKSAAVGD
ncbi:Glycosyltransferase [Hyphomicrobium sp. 1Nfss2.1]|uniref:glycosyltransferase n=1 Tax=Hyphomicrobium sp. 1Nfss2.1 TaxID=3413936 RepID=UPI003C7C0B8B